MIKNLLLTGAIVPALFLTGCGEGWKMKSYEGFPYGNVRTAGHGVEYVRANIMPAKETVIKIIDPENETSLKPKTNLEAKPAPVKSSPVATKEKNSLETVLNGGENFFRDLQRK